jgi:hypothetical protein
MGAPTFADVCTTNPVEYVSAHALHNVKAHGANRDAAGSVAEVLFAMVGSLGYSAS